MSHTVLIVEDEEDLREMMREALEDDGYTVVATCEGEEALAALRSIEHLCLVLLDLLMPGMNGWDFFKAFKAHPGFERVPVVVHSSSPDSAPLGATRVLQKPLKLQHLLDVVHEYCAA
jgi:two-component system chemotaxis response regulator CheY